MVGCFFPFNLKQDKKKREKKKQLIKLKKKKEITIDFRIRDLNPGRQGETWYPDQLD